MLSPRNTQELLQGKAGFLPGTAGNPHAGSNGQPSAGAFIPSAGRSDPRWRDPLNQTPQEHTPWVSTGKGRWGKAGITEGSVVLLEDHGTYHLSTKQRAMIGKKVSCNLRITMSA